MSEDDELRRRIADAHRDDAPPAFGALVEKKRRRRAPLVLVPLALGVAVVLALLLLRPKPAPPPALPSLYVDSRGPLDFLLQMPGRELLRDTPQLDQEGAIP